MLSHYNKESKQRHRKTQELPVAGQHDNPVSVSSASQLGSQVKDINTELRQRYRYMEKRIRGVHQKKLKIKF